MRLWVPFSYLLEFLYLLFCYSSIISIEDHKVYKYDAIYIQSDVGSSETELIFYFPFFEDSSTLFDDFSKAPLKSVGDSQLTDDRLLTSVAFILFRTPAVIPLTFCLFIMTFKHFPL